MVYSFKAIKTHEAGQKPTAVGFTLPKGGAKSGEDLPWPFPGYDVSPALRAASPGRPTSELEHLLRGI